jgi:hypothetical protein
MALWGVALGSTVATGATVSSWGVSLTTGSMAAAA